MGRSRAANRDLLLGLIRAAADGVSRSELGRRSALARGTVNTIVDALIADGLVTEVSASEPAPGRTGRPPRLLRLAPGGGHVAGVLIGTEGSELRFRVVVADLSGAVTDERTGCLDRDAAPDDVFDAVAAAVRTDHLVRTVVGLPVPVARDTGTVLAGGTLPGWVGCRPGVELRRRLGHPVVVRNDADLALLGEAAAGAARGVRDVCLVTIGTGVGCALLLGGHLHRGATGVAGELGHVQVDEAGQLCRCGNRGCLETIVMPAEILAGLREALGPGITLADLVGNDTGQDPLVQRVLIDAGRLVGRVVADVANTVDPSLVLLTGALIEPSGPIVHGVREGLRRYARADVVAATTVAAGALGDRAALTGAITVALGTPPPAGGERARRRQRILDTLRGSGPLSHSDLVHHTGLPRTAVADLVSGLVADGALRREQPQPGRVGRPSPMLSVAPEHGLLLAFSMQEHGTDVLVADGAGTERLRTRVPGVPGATVRQQLADAGRWTRALLDAHGHGGTPLLRAGLSVPSPIDPVTGRLAAPGLLPMFSGFSPADELADALGCPVRAENNANLRAVAETLEGAAAGHRDVLFLRADDHAGAGLIVDGRLHRGARGHAGEIGHLRVRETGPLCLCGNRGCLGQFLAPGYFGAVLEPAHYSSDVVVERALADAGRLLGVAVAPLCDVTNPAVVVVGGRLAETGGPDGPGRAVVDGVREALLRHCPPAVTRDLRVVPAALGADAELRGVLALLRDFPLTR